MAPLDSTVHPANVVSEPYGRRVRVRFEQAVYGSFPFWDKGYAMLAQSPGCRAEWLAELRLACQRFGEPTAEASAAGALFSLRLPSGVWAVVGVSAPGTDDQGRPGALAFHALFLTAREFGRVRFDPFALAGALKRDWTTAIETLPSGAVWAACASDQVSASARPEVGRAVSLLKQGRRIVMESAEPIEALARSIWLELPDRLRRRASVATLAYSAANSFDLVALPHVARNTLDASYISLDDDAALAAELKQTRRDSARRSQRLAAGAALLVLAAAATMVLLLPRQGRDHPAQQIQPSALKVTRPAPDRSRYRDEPIAPEERARIFEGLVDWAERFGVIDMGALAENHHMAEIMVQLSQRLRYDGPMLTEAELAQIAREPEADRRRALGLHAQVARFLADRPLPPDFATGPLRWQLETLAWSFHIEPDERTPLGELPHALAETLAVEGPVRPGALGDRYPALISSARFLSRLSRRP